MHTQLQVDGYHVEGAVIKYKDGSISLVPHIQGSKGAEISGKNIVASVDECQQSYNEVLAWDGQSEVGRGQTLSRSMAMGSVGWWIGHHSLT